MAFLMTIENDWRKL